MLFVMMLISTCASSKLKIRIDKKLGQYVKIPIITTDIYCDRFSSNVVSECSLSHSWCRIPIRPLAPTSSFNRRTKEKYPHENL